MTKKLGIIQSRGLGDIVLALPIALHYQEQGYEIFWPITDTWVKQMQHYVPWVKWIPLQQDNGAFFYDIPKTLLRNFKCDEIIETPVELLAVEVELGFGPWGGVVVGCRHITLLVLLSGPWASSYE